MARFRPVKLFAAWPWLISISLHLVLFGVFALLKFTNISTFAASSATQTLTTAQIKQIAQTPTISPKPKIKKTLPKNSSRKIPLDLSATQKPIQQTQTIASITPSLTDDQLPITQSNSDKTEFFGSFTDQRKICYVVDCSGSMQGRLAMVQNQLKNSIQTLQPDQYFYIIFFKENSLIESAHGRLTRATPKSKKAAFDLIDSITFSGPTNAINAIERAMNIRDYLGKSPALIYFLTDGFDLDDSRTTGFAVNIEKMRKKLAPSTRINTIGFWIGQSDQRILKTVALNSRGQFVNIE
jgi:hypothetical protein